MSVEPVRVCPPKTLAGPPILRAENPPNPYLTEHRELIGEPPPVALEVYEDQSQEILSHNDSPDIGFRWSVNPYRGCFHACSYCSSGDTPILMADGRTKPLSEIRVGDEVYGTELRGTYRHGRYRFFVKTPVLAHWSVVKPAYRIRLEDGTQIVASEDHRFLSHRGWKYVTGTECGGPNQRPHLTINNKLIGTGQFADPPQKDLEYRKGYVCGMVRGDAYLGYYVYRRQNGAKNTQHHFRLALVDGEALHRTQTYLSTFEVPTKEYLFQKARIGFKPIMAIRNQSRQGVEKIQDLIQWPQRFSVNWSKGFLAGIFDSEGSYSKRGILRIHNTSSSIVDTTIDCLNRFGFSWTLETRPGCNRPVHAIRIRGGLKEHLRFFHTTDPAITRKKDIEGQAIKNKSRLRVTAIEDLGLLLLMFDITTGTGDFIANGVVSHNCYARPTHEYFGLGAGTDFERKIFVKKNAPALLEQAFRRRSWQGERIVFSGVTDCYQPLEAAWKLTRGCLETCLKFRNPVGIITKSALIRRDVDLLQGLAREASVGVSISIPFLDEEIARKVEPGAPAIHKRFETLKILADAGIPVGIGVAPVIPGLNDRDIPGLLKRAKENGAIFAFHALLRLPGSVREVFLHRIRRDLPLKAHRIEERVKDSRGGKWYDSRFGHRHSGQGNYWEAVEQAWEIWTERLGFNEREEEPERPSTFRCPDPNGQIQFDLLE